NNLRRAPIPASESNSVPPAHALPSPIVPVVTTYDSGRQRFVPSEASRRAAPDSKNRLNIYGIAPAPTSGPREAYEAPLPRTTSTSRSSQSTRPPSLNHTPQPRQSRKQRPRFDLSNLTLKQVEQLENIYQVSRGSGPADVTVKPIAESIDLDELALREMTVPVVPTTTSTSSPLFVFDKAPKTGANEALHNFNLTSVVSSGALQPDMINELLMIRDIPDLDELTQGLDLSLFNKPGGFAILKQQFIERLIQRSLSQKRRMAKVNRTA
ncbi:Protein MAM-5 b, partial [Aphelenchoides avenae]